MPICQKCGYELVLLSYKPKYKCSLCSRLYSKKQTESRTFRIWNQKQRELDIHNDRLEHKKLTAQERELRKHLRRLFNGLPKTSQQIYQENKDSLYQKEKLRIQKNRKRYNNMRREMRRRNLQTLRLSGNIANYRQRQKALALQYLENKQYKGYNPEIDFSVPTISLLIY